MAVIRVLIPSAMALMLSLLLCPASARLSALTGAIDMPDGGRKLNTVPMPRLGGLGFFLAFLISSLFYVSISDPTATALLAGGSIIVASGVIDDTFGLTPPVKLILQLSSAAVGVLALGAPRALSLLGIITIPLSAPLGFIFALFRTVFSINAVNFCDGLDGLAAGLSSVALISVALYSLLSGGGSIFALALILLFSLLGFLPYNRHPAKIYMGDCGSQFLGFAIATLALGVGGGESFTAETAFFLSIPLIDTWLSVIRRLAKGKNPFSADKGHLHHLLLRKGLSHSAAVRLLVCLSGIIASATLIFLT